MVLPSTTNMTLIHLLTLVMMTLPGMTSSFSQKPDQSELYNYLRELLQPDQRTRTAVGRPLAVPWRDIYSRLQVAAYPFPSNQFGNYVCCNQPPTPPSPRSNFKGKIRALALSLSKRDDRYAPFRWAYSNEAARQEPGMGPSSRSNNNVAIPANLNIPGVKEGGRFAGAEAGRRNPVLLGLLNMLDSSARHGAVSNSAAAAADGSRPVLVVDYPPSSASAGKRGGSATVSSGKRNWGDVGGPNMDWKD